MTSKIGKVELRLSLSRRTAEVKRTESFFAERRARADREGFRQILNRDGGEAPQADDVISEINKL